MNAQRVGILVDTPEGGTAVVLFASVEAADKWRDVAEDRGVTTRGMVPVISRVDGLLGHG